MPEYRRNRLPGATYFFTVNLLGRNSNLLVANIETLREAVRQVRRRQTLPYRCLGCCRTHTRALYSPLNARQRSSSRRASWSALNIAFSKSLSNARATVRCHVTARGTRSPATSRRSDWEARPSPRQPRHSPSHHGTSIELATRGEAPRHREAAARMVNVPSFPDRQPCPYAPQPRSLSQQNRSIDTDISTQTGRTRSVTSSRIIAWRLVRRGPTSLDA